MMGRTATEIVFAKADGNKSYVGVNTFKNALNGRVLKRDMTIAKNYLEEKEIKRLEHRSRDTLK